MNDYMNSFRKSVMVFFLIFYNQECFSSYLIIRLYPGVNPEVIKYINSIVDEESLETIYKGSDVKQALEANLGICPADIPNFCLEFSNISPLLEFWKDNIKQGLANINLKIPVRPKILRGRKIVLKKFSDVARIRQENFGTEAEVPFKALQEFNPSITDFTKLDKDQDINIPFYVAEQIITLKEDKKCSEVNKELTRLVSNFSKPPNCSEVPPKPIVFPESAESSDEISCAESNSILNIISPDILKADLENLNSGMNKCNIETETVSVAILDNGIKSSLICGNNAQQNCIDLVLWKAPVQDTNYWAGFGKNYYTPEKEPFVEEDENEAVSHGTAVAGLTIGGNLYNQLPNVLFNRIQLMIVKTAKNNVFNQSFLKDGILEAKTHGAKIFNLSLESQDHTFFDQFLNSKVEENSSLFIVAAGNSRNPKDLTHDSVNVYPALYGGKERNNIITVAAYDKSKDSLADFSNYGDRTVDLAAEGVCVASMPWDNTTNHYTGTSFSTPLVTFLAGLLYSGGLTTPWDIKIRILAGTSYKPQLKDKIFSYGLLDISKSIRTVFEDSVVYQENNSSPEKTVYGNIINTTFLYKPDYKSGFKYFEVNNIFKINMLNELECSTNNDNCTRTIRYGSLRDDGDIDFKEKKYFNLENNLSSSSCSEQQNVLEFVESGKKNTLCIRLKNLKEIVFSHYGKSDLSHNKRYRLKYCPLKN